MFKFCFKILKRGFMRNLFKITLAVILLAAIASCSDSTTPTNNPNVNIVSEMSASLVNGIQIIKNENQIQANEVDSIKIIRIRILMSEMKLFLDKEDTTGGKMMKTGPFVYDMDGSGKLFQLCAATVLPGVYDKIKFEFHRFNSSEVNQYANDPILKDFATSDRYSMFIEGITYKNNIPSAFTFKSQATANLTLKFEPYLDLSTNSNTTISIQVNPNLFFKKGTSIIDPNDPKNSNDIENAIKSTIKALKK
jgi:hypothetical protein